MPTRHGQSSVAAPSFVVALLITRADAARISAALRPALVCVVTTTDELRRAVVDEPRCRAVIAVAHDVNGEPVGAALRAIATAWPRMPLLGYCGASARETDALRELTRAGVHELLFRDFDDLPALLRARIGRGEEACAAAAVLAAVHSILPASLRPLAQYVVQYPREDHSVARVASALGVHRRTLVTWTERAHAPPPRAVITWCRLLLAVELLQSPGLCIERIANGLEFPSASAFRNLCHRYLGMNPTALRDERALRAAYGAFARALRWNGPAGIAATCLGGLQVGQSMQTIVDACSMMGSG